MLTVPKWKCAHILLWKSPKMTKWHFTLNQQSIWIWSVETYIGPLGLVDAILGRLVIDVVVPGSGVIDAGLLVAHHASCPARHGTSAPEIWFVSDREAEAADARFLTRAGAASGQEPGGKVDVSIQHYGVSKQMTENRCNNNELLCFQQMNRRNKAINY